MSYAVRTDGKGWRAITGPADVGPNEVYNEDQPALIELSAVDGAKAKIEALEAMQIRLMARFDRESKLIEAESLALSQFGLTPIQLYAIGAEADAATTATAAYSYKLLKDLDGAIKIEREKIA